MSKEKHKELEEKVRIEINDKGPCQKEAILRMSAADIAESYNQVLKLFKNEAEIPGFRRGKAPDSFVSAKYDGYIRKHLADLIIEYGFREIVKEKGIKVVAHSPIENLPEASKNADFEYKITLDIMPEFSLPDYKSIKLDMDDSPIAPELIDAEIAALRERFADFDKSEAPAAKGDILKVSLSSDAANNPEFEKVDKSFVCNPETWIWLSEPEHIPGINGALEGATAGEKRSFTAVFPADFREPLLAGKTVNYEVSIVDIQRRKPLDSDEKLCKLMRANSMESLRDTIENRLLLRKKIERRKKNTDKLLNELLAQAGDFPLPPLLLELETKIEYIDIIRKEVKTEEDVKKSDEQKERRFAEARKMAERKLRTYFVMEKIAEQEKISVAQRDFENYISDASFNYKINESIIANKLRNDESLLMEVQQGLLVEKVINFLLDNAEKAAKEKNN